MGSVSTSPRWRSRSSGTAARLPAEVGGSLLRRLLAPGAAGTAGLAAVVLVALVSPEHPGHYPVCPTYALTGLYCPGCGGLRAVHALAHGDPGLALHRNLLVVLAVPFVTWAYVAWVRRRVLARRARYVPGPAPVLAVVALGVVFAVLRNLPAFGWLAP